MTDEEFKTQPGERRSGRSASAESWREVGRQFQALGESLAAAFRTAWENVDNRQQLREAQANLETVADNVSQAIKEAASSLDTQQVRGDVEKIAHSARVASQQTLTEARPHLLSVLSQLRGEIDKMISRLEAEESAAPPAAAVETSPDRPDEG